MEVLTILQVIGCLSAYLVMTFFLPAALLYRKLQKFRFCERFIAYQMVGNFYMMNLVSVLELLHISNRITLILFTLLPSAAIYVVLYKKNPIQMLHDVFDNLERLAGGQVGTRLFLWRVRMSLWRCFKKGVRALFSRIGRNFIDILLVAALTAGLCYIYGTNLLEHFGYCASDLPVHNYWVNYLSRNKIFVAGIYPFGFHCVIYYLHEVFSIPAYVLLRVFGFVQNLMIHYMLLAFARYCCKSKFAPYIGVYMYVFLRIFVENTFLRYFSALPQEFGMIFILPSIYYLFAFFKKKEGKSKEQEEQEEEELPPLSEESIIRIEERGIVKVSMGSQREEVVEKAGRGSKNRRFGKAGNPKKPKKPLQGKMRALTKSEGFWYLAGFAISFGMTLSAHFYDTMIAGLLCIGVACGYCFRLFRPRYFGKVLLTGILSILIAILPMLVAFAMGTPLQGSLGWGMRVISGENSQEAVQAIPSEGASADDGGAMGAAEGIAQDGQSLGTEEDGNDKAGGQVSAKARKPFLQKVISKLRAAYSGFWETVRIYLIMDIYPLFQRLIVGAIVLLAMLSLLFFAVRQTDYGAICLSVSAGMAALSVLQASSKLGLPTLMDATRASIFYAYVLAAAWSLCADGVLQLILGWFKRKWILHSVSLAALAAIVAVCSQAGLIRTPRDTAARQTNDAIVCLTNIMRDNEDFTWTICSADDELRMGEDYGYHHEVHTFLKDLEMKGRVHSITIPTSKVYFFIEKVPVMYGVAYRGVEERISKAYAKEPLPVGSGITMYEGVNRLIEMSKLYEWAQEFAKYYPNDVKVYYESDNFVCYCVEQDLYRPFNFDIDIE